MGAGNDALSAAYDGEWIAGTPNARNCSGFLKSAGKQLGFGIPGGTADDIVKNLGTHAEWESLGKGEAGFKKAVESVRLGRLVIAGVTSADYGGHEGHVAILLPKFGGPHQAPFVYGGSSGAAASKGTKSFRDVFSPKKLAVVQFFRHRTSKLKDYE